MPQIRHTVVIPTYNHAEFIERAIGSVLRQAGDDTEIVVVDDGSTDATYEVVGSMAGPITYFASINRGPGAARNRGIQESSGEFVLFLDADDALLDGALNSLRKATRNWPTVDVLCGGYVSVTQDGRIKKRPLPRVHKHRLRNFKRCITGRLEPQIGATAIRRALLKRRPFAENIRNGEDVVLFAQVLAQTDARSLGVPMVAKFDHTNRLRNDTSRIVASGLDVVDALFDPRILPANLMPYRNVFAARQLLTLARVHYQRQEHTEAVVCFERATSLQPMAALSWKHLRKYIRSLLRAKAEQRLRTYASTTTACRTTQVSSR